MFYRKRRYQRKPVKGKKRVVRKGRGVSKAVKAYVKKTIHKNIENKQWVSSGINQTIVTAASTTPSYINCVPTILQGTASNGRIGDTVSMRKCIVRGFVNLLPYSSLTNTSLPLRLKMWLCSPRFQASTVSSGVLPPTTDFFQGNGTVLPFQGNMYDMMLTVNKESWKVHATKSIELGATIANTGGFSAGSTVWADNSKFTVPFYFEYGKHLGKLHFDDGYNYATNKNLFLIIQAVSADGGNGTLTGAEYHYTIRAEYEDA